MSEGGGDPRGSVDVAPVTRRLLALSVGARRWMALSTLLTLAVTATYVGQGVAVALALARIFTGWGWRGVVPPLAVALALLLVRFGLLWVRELVSIATGAAIKLRLRRRLYEQLFQLGPGYTAGARTGALQATIVDGVEKIETYFSRFLAQLAGAVLGAGAILVGLVVIDPVIGAVLATAAVGVGCTPLLARRLQASRASWFWGSWRRLGAEYLDALQGMATLKAFNASRDRGRLLSRRSWDFYRASIGFVGVANLRTGAMGLLSTGGTALAVGLGALRFSWGAFGSGANGVFDLLLVLLLAREAIRPLEDLQKAYHAAYPALSAADGVLQLLDTEPAVLPPGDPVPVRRGPIALHEVTFSYGPDRPPVLRGLSLDIAEGETVALVGRSGAGKSTVVALLLRFFDPRSGHITLAGRDLRALPLADLRRHIAVVSQDTYLFHGTVRENLLLGDPSASESSVQASARAAGAHEFISRLPQGYDTIVGERGLTLSGGERQRIAIARALLKDAPVLVLDEATSSVDSASEAGIQDALDRLAEGRTTLVIAHRLSSVRRADRIAFLDQGRVSALGTHSELLERSVGYSRLVAAQEHSR